ncbi:unnamed protein product [Lactuca saligna]|uniref:Letm1 RBD domain-containing protein n=1 Tax=Lactuca saligna TaxID=75948 RepID=A0AA35ZQC7_LACSI|nr:unnamed protein product [Lactuca saligna]
MLFGASVANNKILGFAKLFNNEITLHNISRPRLVNMYKYMGIQPFGKNAYLRYMLKKRLQWIKNDVDAISEDELREDFCCIFTHNSFKQEENVNHHHHHIFSQTKPPPFTPP